jgi:hypothetical protein
MKTIFNAEVWLSDYEVTPENVDMLIEDVEDTLKFYEIQIYMLGMSNPKDFRDKAGDEHASNFDSVRFVTRDLLEGYSETILELYKLRIYKSSRIEDGTH